MSKIKFAIPCLNGELTEHFGHCEKFSIIDVENNSIVNEVFINPPVHQPGVYPKFLAEQGVKIIIAGGIGQKAKDLFAENNIQVHNGVQKGDPKTLVENYLSNELKTGDNLCNH